MKLNAQKLTIFGFLFLAVILWFIKERIDSSSSARSQKTETAVSSNEAAELQNSADPYVSNSKQVATLSKDESNLTADENSQELSADLAAPQYAERFRDLSAAPYIFAGEKNQPMEKNPAGLKGFSGFSEERMIRLIDLKQAQLVTISSGPGWALLKKEFLRGTNVSVAFQSGTKVLGALSRTQTKDAPVCIVNFNDRRKANLFGDGTHFRIEETTHRSSPTSDSVNILIHQETNQEFWIKSIECGFFTDGTVATDSRQILFGHLLATIDANGWPYAIETEN